MILILCMGNSFKVFNAVVRFILIYMIYFFPFWNRSFICLIHHSMNIYSFSYSLVIE